MPTERKIDAIAAWKKSRSGAWAGRGFHYQHLFSTLVLIRQWAGLAPAGNIVPEGLEDCVIELPSQEFWLQAKSRKEGTFSTTEVQQTLLDQPGNLPSVTGVTGNRILGGVYKGFRPYRIKATGHTYHCPGTKPAGVFKSKISSWIQAVN